MKRPVDLGHHAPGARIVGPDDDPVRVLEVADRRALSQEFGIRDDGNPGGGILFTDDALDLVSRPDRHRRFRNHHRLFGNCERDLARRGMDMGKVGMAVAAAGWRAHRNEYDIGSADG